MLFRSALAGRRDYIVGTYPTERAEEGRFRWTRRRATFTLVAPQPHLVIRYHVGHPDVDARPVKIRITTPCQTLVDEFRHDTDTVTRAFELPDGQAMVRFDVEVSRTWSPADSGQPDRRSLGAAIQADFVAESGVVSSISGWVPLTPCSPV